MPHLSTKCPVLLCFPIILAAAVPTGAQPASYVVVFGVDGLSSRGIETASTPVMHGLMAHGMWTLDARAVIPAVSSPNWSAMIMGAAPDVTGVTSNDWMPAKHRVVPSCDDGFGHSPTIFGLIRKTRPELQSALFTDWPDFFRLIEPSAASHVFSKDGDAPEAVGQAIRYMIIEKPALTFIHVDHVDHAGHTFGWDTPEYLRAVEQGDELLGLVVKALDDSGMRSKSVLLVTSDHGGHEKTHGAMIQKDLAIPWIAAGHGIMTGEIVAPVSTTQTAPTIAQWLGLKPSECWITRPVEFAPVRSH
jgi:predicted AlkP superfamily pyrophosphatase or phosphodiesterase